MEIPFNKPYITGQEIENIARVIELKKLAGDGEYTASVQKYMEDKYGFKKTLLTTSCTDALEMCALLANIDSQSEIIMPSYTFVSTANAFALRGAKIVFADSERITPNIDVNKIEELITEKTRVIVAMHYAGASCDMDKINSLSEKYNLIVIEDAAQAIDSYYKNQPLGTIGALSTFSFHETKNLTSGEGGLLAINRPEYIMRAEIIREKGTNRSQFFRGEIDKYGWVDIGSSFLASELIAAFLMAQLNKKEDIQQKRRSLWNRYYNNLSNLGASNENLLPIIPEYATNNAHMFYLTCEDIEERTKLMKTLSSKGIKSTFHYLSLHKSNYYKDKHDGRELSQADKWADCLVRLPMFTDLTYDEVDYISENILNFYNA
ncbi:dTDP-4-amino-4,6-dideoxygalactose transaminase [Asinibacterium sp. OR53]|uniref:dTDP-4-amino-4,6-dideoxygalactose transaminase n=1 Tax=Asinibacterium sp. OR53 TaxID=925409 RepID=UPI0004B03A06|nr:dTDP-4-amino-4,6-dideoxygalactose transaminase [Asinibacterium sp. OR53]